MKKMYIIAATLLLGACSKFLEPKSPTEVTPATAEHLDELLLGIAYPRPDADFLGCLLDAVSDDVSGAGYHKGGNSEGTGFYDKPIVRAVKIAYTWQPDYSRLIQLAGGTSYDMYSPVYRFLTGANAVIDHVATVAGSVEEKNLLLAQALTLRGYYYLHLVNIFGVPYNVDPDGPGVPLKLTAAVEQRLMTRNSVREVYDRVVTDLREAERLFATLPAEKQFRKNYRVNILVARHLLARAYLYMERWKEAEEVASSIISYPGVALVNLEDLVNAGYTNVRASASNDTRKYYNFISHDNPECYWLFGSSTGACLYTQNIIARATGTNATNCAYLLQASAPLVNSFENGDARKLLYLASDVYATTAINLTGYGAIGKYPMLLGDRNNLIPASGSRVFGQALRLAEAYITRAEARAMLYKQGDASAATGAIDDLNAIRSKRFLAASYVPLSLADFSTADALVDKTREERRKELCFEGLRWFDQRRQGMKRVEHRWYTGPETTTASVVSYETYVLEDNDPGFTFPLPREVMEQNTALEQLPNLAAERLPATITP
ncbi:MAG: RagB/SusD family nutrient uptake outer membrane protein [Odoribacteraceae bacterium]|jgi:hypothetical protein|nr:RagB/SusD family nutrient uptake outer membrane protein [Odoribacteraceae bacterium]